MSIEIKQVHKLSQQLVMTPQLQQAIKLLQLSRMELVDLVREEMMENPILEDGEVTAAGARQGRPRRRRWKRVCRARPSCRPPRRQGRTRRPEVTGTDSTAESQAVNEIDWENYIDNYSSAPSMPSYKPYGDELPSLESTLTKKTSLEDHLVWQLKHVELAVRRGERRHARSSATSTPTATSRSRRSTTSPTRRGVPVEFAEQVLAQAPGVRSGRRRARARCRSAAHPGASTSAPTTTSSSR